MKDQLLRAMKNNQIVDIMYMANDGAITKRRIKPSTIKGEAMQAYCFARGAKRLFKIDNILAIMPVIKKASGLNA